MFGESHFTSISGLGGSILYKKSQDRCTLLESVLYMFQ
jgi:hypothetical protein